MGFPEMWKPGMSPGKLSDGCRKCEKPGKRNLLFTGSVENLKNV